MEALQGHIQSYGNAMDSLDAYKQQADKDFFDNWMGKVDEVNKRVEAVGRGLEATGTSIEGAKLLKKGGQYIASKLRGKGENTDADGATADDAGSGGAGDGASGTSATSNPRSGANAEGQEGAGAEGGGGEGGLADLGYTEADAESFFPSSAPPASVVADASETATGFTQSAGGNAVGASRPFAGLDDEFGGEPLDQARSLGQQTLSRGPQSAPDPTSGGSQATGGQSGTEGGTPDTELSSEGPTLEGAPQSAIDATAGDIGGDASTAITGATEAGTGALEGITAGLSTAMDFLGPVGLLAGLGVELYEAFHGTPTPPKPPQAISGRQRGAVVLPTYDSVQDTPASASAF
jgi:hypothetical protein